MKVAPKLVSRYLVIICLLIIAWYLIRTKPLIQKDKIVRQFIQQGLKFQNDDEYYQSIKVNQFLRLLRSSDNELVIRVLCIMGITIDRQTWKVDEIIAALSNKLGSNDWLIRFHSAAVLGQINCKKVMLVLKDAWFKETNKMVLYQIFESLCNIGRNIELESNPEEMQKVNNQVVWIFMESLAKEGLTDRGLLSAIGLSELTSDQEYMLNILQNALDQIDIKSKIYIIWVIGNQGTIIYHPILHKASKDENLSVRQLAGKYLEQTSK